MKTKAFVPHSLPFLLGLMCVVVGAPGADVVWKGDTGAVWDIEATANWADLNGPCVYRDGDAVTFDGTTAETNITIIGTVSPHWITVTTNRNYSFTGSIAGSGGISNLNGSYLTLGGTAPNTYTGLTYMSRGRLMLNKANGVRAISGDVLMDAPTGNPFIRWLADDQIQGAGSIIATNNTTAFAYLELLGHSDTVTGIAGPTNTVLQNGGVSWPTTDNSTLTIDTPAGQNFVWSGKHVRDQNSGTSPGKLLIVKTGPGTQTLAALSDMFFWSPCVVSNGTIVVTGTARLGGGSGKGSMTVYGGTLAGDGTIHLMPVTIETGGTLQPGLNDTSIGNLSFTTQSAGPVLRGTTKINVNRDASVNASQLICNSINIGGTLAINNLGSPLQPGDSFQILAAWTYSGEFANITPAQPGPGLAWDTSSLATDGTIRVAVGSAEPLFSSVSFKDGQLIMEGRNGVPSATFYVLTSTNVSAPLSQWVPVVTNAFDSTGGFSLSLDVGSAPQGYFWLQVP